MTQDIFRKIYAPLTEEQTAMVQKLKETGELLYALYDKIGVSHETAIAKTKLEESMMWAVKHTTGPGFVLYEQ